MSPTLLPASRGSRNGAGRRCGTGERLRPLARWAPVTAISFFAKERKAAAGVARTPPPFRKRATVSDKGVWMSVWVDDVDSMHKQCVAAGLEVTFPPNNMPWHVREMHLRHPDGHVFRVSQSLEENGN